jgi:hypothetical protein
VTVHFDYPELPTFVSLQLRSSVAARHAAFSVGLDAVIDYIARQTQ